MIHQNELRIGNWITDRNPDTGPQRVTALWVKSCYYGDGPVPDHLFEKPFKNRFKMQYRSAYKDLRPIQITPEIMEKCGFEKHKNSNEYWDFWVLPNGWHIGQWKLDESPAGFEKKGVCYWGDEYIKAEFLHDLQNLYFAHTRKELNYQP